MSLTRTVQSWLPVCVLATSLSALALAGCERKETLLDVETPGANIEVERNIDTGEVDVEATDNN